MDKANFNNPFPRSAYDRTFNILYLNVNPTMKTGIMKSKSDFDEKTVTNLAIYDIGKNELSHFFEKGNTKKILHLFYETGYNEKQKKMDFNKEHFPIFNNEDIEERAKSDKLFIVAEGATGEECEFWVSTRLGENKKRIKTFPKELDWRIDVFNQKVLFIYRLEDEVKIDAYDW